MDFHSLPRRDLQSLCKKNKIPANITNVAMADALKALEIVEGLEEFLNQTEPAAPLSPSSVAITARTATRTTRRTAKKDATQTSQSMTRSCRVTRKSLAGEMDQENSNMNALLSAEVRESDVKLEANVPKTPAAQSTRRKALPPSSLGSKALETKENVSVQKVYSTRRSVRLLEKCMADLSLKPKEDLDEPVEHNDTEKEKATQEKEPAGFEFQGKSDDNSERTEEPEVNQGRDLSATLEKEWDARDEGLEDNNGTIDHDPDSVKPESEDRVDLSAFNVKSETYNGNMNELDICQGGDKEETQPEKRESEITQAFDSSIQVEDNGSPQAKSLYSSQKTIQDEDSEVLGHPASATSPVMTCKEILDSEFKEGPIDHEKTNEKDMTRGSDDDDKMETCKETLDSPLSEDDKQMNINADDEDSESEQSNSYSDDSESEEDNTGVDSNQTVFKSDAAGCAGGSVLKSLTVDTLEADSSSESSESDESDSEEEDIISDADSNTAVLGEELEDSESGEDKNLEENKTGGSAVNMSPLPVSPFAAESVSGQFPRPTLSTTTPVQSSSKKKQESSSALKLSILADDENKAEMPKKKKKSELNEERLKDVSLRQLTKMVKELSIKSNRTALQTLPGNLIG
ncbi:PREDICTED: dentin matrix acidic phosphoprotein 1-like [Tarenaya hassleriana]|uniref:dentin matrix acidic phosphoprotein 1-like n=1 Tax=Tarenaya hassleriana TaxID=28532 RepID=UPI00053C3CF7|nr:PREDICTED: dentin matrix acidic phosphoprotein 1-like [Tarenaya hassleriana]